MKLKKFLHELKHHAPFTLTATIIAIMLTAFIVYFLKQDIPEITFEIIHISHIIVSAIVTAGIYYKYKPSITKALLIGITGSIIIGSISDIIFPWLGGTLLGAHMHFHLPIIEMPLIILGATIIGSIIGIKTKLTKMPHFVHVFLSVFASLFYLLIFSSEFFVWYFLGAFLIVFIAVIMPCCVSDILFPFMFMKNKKQKTKTNKTKIKNKTDKKKIIKKKKEN